MKTKLFVRQPGKFQRLAKEQHQTVLCCITGEKVAAARLPRSAGAAVFAQRRETTGVVASNSEAPAATAPMHGAPQHNNIIQKQPMLSRFLELFDQLLQEQQQQEAAASA
jgi:hypothetical protein